MHITIIEDEVLLGEKMRMKLINQGYGVTIFTSFNEFMSQGGNNSHLYVIDIGLGDGSGFDIIHWLRKKQNSKAPIMITSGYGETDKIVYGLDIGADDYMVKPCIPDEFIARVDALARRSVTNEANLETLKTFTYKNISYFPYTQLVLRSGEKVYLSKKEGSRLANIISYNACIGLNTVNGVLIKFEKFFIIFLKILQLPRQQRLWI